MTYRYQIFQLGTHNPEVVEKMYHNYNDILVIYGKVNFDEYAKVYEGELSFHDNAEYQALDALFEMFNVSRPDDFQGHSLSVGDIVVLNDTKFYCDSFGWRRLK